jgi:MFS transporter, ACS family, tartrate transporter
MQEEAIERQTVRTVSWRILPFLFVLYVFSFLDRSNVSIAALQMNDELRFSSTVFGLGAGLFSIGYSLFEIPSNFVLSRVGARRWIARIVVSWGILATAMMFIHTPAQFYAVRFLLGIAEAGFFPGVIYYIAQWYPMGYRARAAAVFTVAIPLSQVLGGAIGGSLLGLGGTANLSGWQWLFLIEGAPSFVLGIIVWFYLTDSPSEAHWLSAIDRDWLVARLGQERETFARPAIGYWRALRTPVCWWLALMYFSFLTIGVGYTSWIALLVRGALATQNTITGFITAGISLVAAGSYLVTAQLSDKTNDRYFYAVVGLALCVAGCLGAAFAPLPWFKVFSLAIIPIGSGVFLPSFWCLPTMKFGGPFAASAIALISAVGSSGGFFGPSIIGYLKHSTGGDVAAFVTLAGIGLVGCGVGVVLRRKAIFDQCSYTGRRPPCFE